MEQQPTKIIRALPCYPVRLETDAGTFTVTELADVLAVPKKTLYNRARDAGDWTAPSVMAEPNQGSCRGNSTWRALGTRPRPENLETISKLSSFW
jgi:hypothetical protein